MAVSDSWVVANYDSWESYKLIEHELLLLIFFGNEKEENTEVANSRVYYILISFFFFWILVYESKNYGVHRKIKTTGYSNGGGTTIISQPETSKKEIISSKSFYLTHLFTTSRKLWRGKQRYGRPCGGSVRYVPHRHEDTVQSLRRRDALHYMSR